MGVPWSEVPAEKRPWYLRETFPPPCDKATVGRSRFCEEHQLEAIRVANMRRDEPIPSTRYRSQAMRQDIYGTKHGPG